jgi:regulator of RNase E activity RraA
MEIKSKLQNCHLVPPAEGDPLFFAEEKAVVLNKLGETVYSGDLVIANLDGYAIVPKAEYEEAKEKAWQYDELCK